MRITKLSSSDWQIFKHLWLEALKNEPTAFFNIYEEKIHDSDLDWQEKFTEIFQNYYFAIDGDTPVGLAGYFLNTRTKSRHVAELVRVYVSPRFRKQGVGKQLLESVITELKSLPQITKIKIQAIASQVSAINLYKSLGFKEVGRLHHEIITAGTYYDEILLEMMIDSSYN